MTHCQHSSSRGPLTVSVAAPISYLHYSAVPAPWSGGQAPIRRPAWVR